MGKRRACGFGINVSCSMARLLPEGAAGALPRPLLCRGTEPFWSVGLRADGATLATPEGARELRLLAEGDRDAALERARQVLDLGVRA